MISASDFWLNGWGPFSSADAYLALPTGASTPDQAGISSVPFDVRVKVAFQSYADGVIYQNLMGQTGNIGNGTYRWEVYLDPSGYMVWKHYTTAAVNVTIQSTVPLSVADGATIWLRVTYDPATGSANFYTAVDINGISWTPLGTVVTVGAADVRAGLGAPVQIGTDIFPNPARGKFYRAQLLMSGSMLLNMNFETATPGSGPWTATTGETWTRTGTSVVVAAVVGTLKNVTMTSASTSTTTLAATKISPIKNASFTSNSVSTMRLLQQSRMFGALIGPHYTGTQSPYDGHASIDAYAALVGKYPSIGCWGLDAFDAGGPSASLFNTIANQGMINYYNFGTENTHHDNFCDWVTAGGLDAKLIADYFPAMLAFNKPFIIRPMWEMSAPWYQWGVLANGNTYAKYVAAWQHLHDLFVANGVTKASWFWCAYPYQVSGTFGVPSVPMEDYHLFYPGDAYVDFVGFDAYRQAPDFTTTPWQLMQPIYDKIKSFTDKPMIIGEWGVDEDIASPGSKATYITAFFDTMIKRMPRVKIHTYFDVTYGGTNGSMHLNYNVSGANAYAAGVASELYASNRFSALATKVPVFGSDQATNLGIQQASMISDSRSTTYMHPATKYQARMVDVVSSGNYFDIMSAGATTPDQAANFTTTAIYDIQTVVALNSYATGAYQSLISQSGIIGAGNFRYTFLVDPSGFLFWQMFDASNVSHNYTSTVAVPATNGQKIGIRAVIDPTVSSVTFYTSSNEGATWTPLGTTVTAAATVIRTQTTPGPVKIGSDAYPSPTEGRFYRVKMIVAGVTRIDMNFEAATPGAGPWTGAAGEVWTRVSLSSNVIAGGVRTTMSPNNISGVKNSTLASASSSTTTLTASRRHASALTSASTSATSMAAGRLHASSLSSSSTSSTTMVPIRRKNTSLTSASTSTTTMNSFVTRSAVITSASTSTTALSPHVIRRVAMTSTGISTTTMSAARRASAVLISTGLSSTTITPHVIRRASFVSASTSTTIMSSSRKAAASFTSASTSATFFNTSGVRNASFTSSSASTTALTPHAIRRATITSASVSTTSMVANRWRRAVITSASTSGTTMSARRVAAGILSSGSSSATAFAPGRIRSSTMNSVSSSTTTMAASLTGGTVAYSSRSLMGMGA